MFSRIYHWRADPWGLLWRTFVCLAYFVSIGLILYQIAIYGLHWTSFSFHKLSSSFLATIESIKTESNFIVFMLLLVLSFVLSLGCNAKISMKADAVRIRDLIAKIKKNFQYILDKRSANSEKNLRALREFREEVLQYQSVHKQMISKSAFEQIIGYINNEGAKKTKDTNKLIKLIVGEINSHTSDIEGILSKYEVQFPQRFPMTEDDTVAYINHINLLNDFLYQGDLDKAKELREAYNASELSREEVVGVVNGKEIFRVSALDT